MSEPMAPHHCTGCGEMHGGEHRENPEVAIARIQAERDIRVAELNRGEFDKTELEAETEIAVAEIDAAAAVEEAVVKADVLDDILTPEDPPEEVVIVSDETEPAEPVAEDEPPEIDAAPAPSRKSNPWW